MYMREKPLGSILPLDFLQKMRFRTNQFAQKGQEFPIELSQFIQLI